VVVRIDDGDRRLPPNPTSDFVVFGSFRAEGERERREDARGYI
jgi:hypothetical protein